MAINAVKKLLQGDTPFTLTELGSGTVSSAEIAASAITNTKVAASAIVKDGLKYKINAWSLKGDAAASVTTNIVTSGNILGMYLTKITSHANLPILTQASNSITISLAQALVGSDVCEGVIITIEP